MIPSDIKITPWLEQYKAFKEEYPNAILLFRMGDFYEMFFDDARNAADTLNIALTARDPEKKIPMAGIPHHALNSYLSRLIRAGYRAAVYSNPASRHTKVWVEGGPTKFYADRMVEAMKKLGFKSSFSFPPAK